jgi:uncharacterized protein
MTSRLLFVATLAWASASTSHAAPPTEESIKTLMALTRTEAMLDQVYAGMEQSMRQGMQQALAGQTMTITQQQMVAAAPVKLMAVLREELSWAKMLPDYVTIYKETFEQGDIDGMIAFYRSSPGQSFVAKMPMATQKSMVMTQERMKDILPKLQAAMQQVVADIKATEAAK